MRRGFFNKDAESKDAETHFHDVNFNDIIKALAFSKIHKDMENFREEDSPSSFYEKYQAILSFFYGEDMEDFREEDSLSSFYEKYQAIQKGLVEFQNLNDSIDLKSEEIHSRLFSFFYGEDIENFKEEIILHTNLLKKVQNSFDFTPENMKKLQQLYQESKNLNNSDDKEDAINKAERELRESSKTMQWVFSPNDITNNEDKTNNIELLKENFDEEAHQFFKGNHKLNEFILKKIKQYIEQDPGKEPGFIIRKATAKGVEYSDGKGSCNIS